MEGQRLSQRISERASERGTILIVDDTLQNLQLIGEILESNGYNVVFATGGRQALESLKTEDVDLILLDVLMPEMNGFEVCKVLKSAPHTKEIPIIFLTIYTDIEGILQAFEIGAVDYITKPVHQAELLARVITHVSLYRAQRRLEEQNKRLVELNTEKNEFLSMVTHGLKNPLTSIRLGAEIVGMALSKTPMHLEKATDNAKRIEMLADRMLQIVQNCLEADAIEQGRIFFSPTTFDLRGLCSPILDRYKLQAEAKTITLHFHEHAEECPVFADRDAVQEVVENLLSNAIKYSPTGKSVWVSVSVSEMLPRHSSSAVTTTSDVTTDGSLDNSKQWSLITVRDEGLGIGKEDMKRMFEKYARLTAQPTGGEHSTGLGLSIVKKLVDSMNGRIWCESEVGKGTTFVVELPRTDATH